MKLINHKIQFCSNTYISNHVRCQQIMASSFCFFIILPHVNYKLEYIFFFFQQYLLINCQFPSAQHHMIINPKYHLKPKSLDISFGIYIITVIMLSLDKSFGIYIITVIMLSFQLHTQYFSLVLDKKLKEGFSSA